MMLCPLPKSEMPTGGDKYLSQWKTAVLGRWTQPERHPFHQPPVTFLNCGHNVLHSELGLISDIWRGSSSPTYTSSPHRSKILHRQSIPAQTNNDMCCFFVFDAKYVEPTEASSVQPPYPARRRGIDWLWREEQCGWLTRIQHIFSPPQLSANNPFPDSKDSAEKLWKKIPIETFRIHFIFVLHNIGWIL